MEVEPADRTVFSVSASGASCDVDCDLVPPMCRVRCGGRFEDNLLAGTGVVGRGNPDPEPDADPRAGMLDSEHALRLLSRMTSLPPVTFGDTALAKLQLDMLSGLARCIRFVCFLYFLALLIFRLWGQP